jgi:hydrogenase expression/formation protein HypD
MEVLVQDGEAKIDGFVCPAHVSTIIGARAYTKLCAEYRIPCVVTGFEPVDILQGILLLVRQLEQGEARVEIQYSRAATQEGNRKALQLLETVFEPSDEQWRGFGTIPGSGLKLREQYGFFDVLGRIDVEVEEEREHPGCICGSILRGVSTPEDCALFRKVCRPEHPVGACMVSSEGACSAHYKYGES